MVRRIEHVVVERKSGSVIVRSRHYSDAAAIRAQDRYRRALEHRYPSNAHTTVLVGYVAMPVWYRDGDREPRVGDLVGTFDDGSTEYAVAPREARNV